VAAAADGYRDDVPIRSVLGVLVVLVSGIAHAVEPPAEAPPPAPALQFGSYGRVVGASDLSGRTGRNTDLVRFGTRLDESTYAELNLSRLQPVAGRDVKVVFTLALFGPLFHFDGDASDVLAVRQAFAEVADVGVKGLSVWAGSRIARGDDVYLLDFWPLDNLNLVGGGARHDLGDIWEFASHVGLFRLRSQYQYQVVDAAAVNGFGVERLELLDRPRTVWANKATFWPGGRFQSQGFKLVGYAEAHAISAGTFTLADRTTRVLPADGGWVAGLQFGAWHGPSRSFVNAFVRASGGLGAFNPFESPFADGLPVTTTERAFDVLGAVVGNVEFGSIAGIQLGAYLRRSRDAAVNEFSGGSVLEGIVTARPHWWFSSWGGLAAEVSFQSMSKSALDERTGLPLGGSLWKFALMPYITPGGSGGYTRPHLRLIYVATVRDASAIALAVEEDVRGRAPVEHFLGVGAEWWFDSSYR